jgi:hypothetical protein
LHDGVTFEGLGIPTAVVCTEPFIPTAQSMARILGMPNYPFVTIPHPLGSLPEEELKERARMALPQVLGILLGQNKP